MSAHVSGLVWLEQQLKESRRTAQIYEQKVQEALQSGDAQTARHYAELAHNSKLAVAGYRSSLYGGAVSSER